MRVLIAGATGAIGSRLSTQLLSAGHDVIGLTRTNRGAFALARAGVKPIIVDALHRPSLLRALEPVSADVVVHQMTSLTKAPARHSDMEQTNRLRTCGTANLLAAARLIGAGRFVTQSIVMGYGYTDHGGTELTEADPYGAEPHGRCGPHVAAMLTNERLVRSATGMDGIALRYGMFYGADMPKIIDLLKKRRLPIPAQERGNLLPWIHIDDAAAATVLAISRGRAGEAYNITDELPCSWGQFFSEMAEKFGTPAPRTLPAWVIRMAAPYIGALVLDTSMRVSTAKARHDLGWRPVYPEYRDGFAAYAAAA